MRSGSDLWIRAGIPLLLVASALAAIVAISVAAGRSAPDLHAATESEPSVVLRGTDDPIAAEAQVFRTHAGVLAIDPTPGPRRHAHPRTLARFRLLRAYPGAPPRIPHGLTPEETQVGGCNTCHERGGYSERFGAYVPVTPHPELRDCLQCHVGDATLLAVPLPGTDPSARCRQCHTPGSRRWSDSAVAWKPMAWPAVSERREGAPPPPIPHGRELRGNCLSCHAAPAAVAEITTSHPERADCLQCHVPGDAASDESIQQAQAFVRRTGGGQ